MSELLLLSGGIDSIAIAAWLRPAQCLTIDYGQRPAAAEVDAASEVCRRLGLFHDVIRVPINELGSGALAGKPVSEFSSHEEFWPFRNQFLLTLGAMYAMPRSLNAVLIGTVQNDSRHADGSPVFLNQIADLVAQQEGGIAIVAPAIHLDTVELVKVSNVDPSLLGWAHSCHTSHVACGRCPGCNKHSEVMRVLGWEL
ncbi:7-cyano-7-deazaguanine synthase [Granulicella sp. 5B5]|uniref:7-cyano-7-deazaguanine synthase n=1 Tax=Granulicella sp. 5B5 TaxID=1617967 RepID=UPI0015F6C14D|nr:7-cyano-7-deazaguanine synthase [Granulicella sp. 5B5]QMV19720.1 7-cyano-7-deazaguanine synthase [Granulicella sp. 5B5]